MADTTTAGSSSTATSAAAATTTTTKTIKKVRFDEEAKINSDPIPRWTKHAAMTEFNGTPIYPKELLWMLPSHFQHNAEQVAEIVRKKTLRKTVSADCLVDYDRRWLVRGG